MDRETYTNPQTAEYINRHFVAVKVDFDASPRVVAQLQRAAESLGIETKIIEAKEGDDFIPLFEQARAVGAQAVQIVGATYFTSPTSEAAIGGLGLRYNFGAR